MNSVKIVIPLYKTDLDETEIMSLKRSIQVLSKHQFTIVCPNHLEINSLANFFENVDWEVKRFSDHFFKNIDGYNQLMLSEVFYKAFSDVDYILICQTDVFVFRDELNDWCNKNYDYIGAPWIGSQRNFWNKSMLAFRNYNSNRLPVFVYLPLTIHICAPERPAVLPPIPPLRTISGNRKDEGGNGQQLSSAQSPEGTSSG